MAGKAASRRATPSAANRGVQARPGDATGKENERLRKENAAALQEASQSMTLVNPPPVVEETDQVVDYTQGGDVHTGGDGGARLITMDEATADGTAPTTYDIAEADVDLDSLPTGEVGTPVPEVVLTNPQEPQPAAGERVDSQQQVRPQGAPEQPAPPAPEPAVVQRQEAPVVEQAHRMLRVNTDLEDITIGKDNHYTFLVGTPYKVNKNVYDHLAEKGYVLR